MKCQNCGKDIPEGKFYCESCGTAVQIVPDYNPVEDIPIVAEEKDTIKTSGQTDTEPEELPVKRHWKRYAAGGIGLVVFGLAAFHLSYRFVLLPQETTAEPEEPVLLERPVFSVPPGTYDYSPLLTISHAQRDEGIIYYTTDGTTPGPESKVFNNPIELVEGKNIIRAVFIHSDGTISEEMDGIYDIVFDYPEEPVFSVEAGEYSSGFPVMITAEKDCEIRYTTNGEEPGYESSLYRGSIYIHAGLTVLQAVAIDEEGMMSGITEAIYNVSENSPPPEENTEPIQGEEGVIP